MDSIAIWSASQNSSPLSSIAHYGLILVYIAFAVLLLLALLTAFFILIPTGTLDALGRYTGNVNPPDERQTTSKTYRQLADEATAYRKKQLETAAKRDFEIEWARKIRARGTKRQRNSQLDSQKKAIRQRQTLEASQNDLK
ncbi:hypothetical protein TWF696_004738 [Orbilia brochopaga]|uniref:Uncharacterized protein n=1 Tax=Orbilia brochopaga TaxID=3140254 RepID=A0AAV9V0Y1_9PEZI